MKQKSIIIVTAIILILSFAQLAHALTWEELIRSTRGRVLGASTTGLVGYWNFDEGSGTTAADSSGGGNTGTLVNGLTWATGKVGSGALSFDGANDVVTTGSDFIGTSAVTISAWVYGRSAGQVTSTILDNGKTRVTYDGFRRVDFASDGVTYINGPVVGPYSQWSHFAITRDASGITNFYINGVFSGNANRSSGTPTAGTGNVRFGNSMNGVHTYDGLLDEIRIYNRVLSATEILDVYNDTGSAVTATPASDTTPPIVSISSPSSGVTVSGTTVLTANASDDTGVAGVQFKLDGVNLGSEDISSPYSYSWDTTAASNGPHTLTAVARDAAGNTTTSSPVTVTVSNTAADTTAPVISSVASSAVTSSSASIAWTTNEASDSQVDYGLTTSYGSQTILSSSLITSHSQSLSSLLSSTLYHYRVRSKDSSGNLALSGDNTFTTNTASISVPSSSNKVELLNSSGSVLNSYSTIQACANVAVAGQTCLVYPGLYNERVTPVNSGTAGNIITYKAVSDCVTNNGATVSSLCPKIRGFSATGKNFITVQGLEFTTQGMSHDGTRVVAFSTSDHITFLNNYVHDTDAPFACVNAGAQSTNIIFRGNNIKLCGEAMDVYATIRGPYNIQSGINDKISISVQGGAPQIVTLTPGSARSATQLASDVNTQLGGSSTGPIWAIGGPNNSFSIRSNTHGPTSSIEVLSVANSVYATMGMSIGLGTMTGHNAAFGGTGAIPPAVTDWLIENNVLSYLGDYLTPGSGSRLVYRNNQLGPSGIYNNDHIDGVQQGGFSQGLMEGNISVDNNSSDNHFYLNQAVGDLWIVRFNSTCRAQGGVAQGAYSTAIPNHLYFYNNTFYDNFAWMYGNHGSQVTVSYSPNNAARNNIWYKSEDLIYQAYYTYPNGAAIDRDYDLWYLMGSPSEAHAVNADPLIVDATNCNFNLQSSSPAINKGGPLTTVSSTDTGSGTTLVVSDAHFFQDGWAGVSPDWIAIGTTGNAVQIASIDYTNNIINLASSLSRSSGDPVYLYKNSSGTQVLYGSAPDIGAYEYNSGGVASPSDTTAPSTPVNLIATAISSSAVNLSWTASTDSTGVAGYKIYRGGVQVGTSVSTSYSDTGLSPSTAYSYAISAYDAAGNNSSQSVAVSASTESLLPVISNLVGSQTTATSTTISWNTNVPTDGQVFYGLSSSYNLQSALVDFNIKTTSHSITLTNLNPSTIYHFQARSADASANNVLTSDFTFTTLALPTAPAPVITSFRATPSAITQGAASLLAWVVANAKSISIDNNVGSQSSLSAGSVSVSPANPTTYTLTATNSSGSATAQVTVNVSNPIVVPTSTSPTIISFTANPTNIFSGQSVVLSFTVTGSPTPALSLNNGVGDVSGLTTKTLAPSVNTTYTLTATNSAGSATAQVTVTVTAAPLGAPALSSPSPGSSGSSLTITYIPVATATPASTLIPPVVTSDSTPPAAISSNSNNLRLIKDAGTYYLVMNNQLHGITNPGMLSSYGFSFSDAKPATIADKALPKGSLLLPNDGSLVKSKEDKTVYLISNSTRYAFTSVQVFKSLGFKFSQVLVVTNPELQALPKSSTNISNGQSAHLPGLDINRNGVVYWIDNNSTLHPYPSLSVYNSWHIHNDFSRVVKANSADNGLPVGGMVSMRVVE